MPKLMVVVDDPSDAHDIDLPGRVRRRILTADEATARPHAIVSLWLDAIDDDAVRALPGHAYEVDEQVIWDDAEPALERTVLNRRRADIDHATFVDRWAQHAVLARVHYPALCRYIQNVVLRAITPGAPESDGVSELGFWDREAMETRMYDSPEGRATMAADLATFLDTSRATRVLGVAQW